MSWWFSLYLLPSTVARTSRLSRKKGIFYFIFIHLLMKRNLYSKNGEEEKLKALQWGFVGQWCLGKFYISTNLALLWQLAPSPSPPTPPPPLPSSLETSHNLLRPHQLTHPKDRWMLINFESGPNKNFTRISFHVLLPIGCGQIVRKAQKLIYLRSSSSLTLILFYMAFLPPALSLEDRDGWIKERQSWTITWAWNEKSNKIKKAWNILLVRRRGETG